MTEQLAIDFAIASARRARTAQRPPTTMDFALALDAYARCRAMIYPQEQPLEPATRTKAVRIYRRSLGKRSRDSGTVIDRLLGLFSA